MSLVVCDNFLTVLEQPTVRILRLFIPLIVDQIFATIKGFSQLFYLRQLITNINSSLLMQAVKGELVMVEYTEIAFFIELPKRIYQNFCQINLCLFLAIHITTAKIPSQCHTFFWLMTRFAQVNIVLNLQSGLTPIKHVFNYRLSRVRRVTENAFAFL